MKLLSLIMSALVCTSIEPIHDYQKLKVEDQKWGLQRARSFGIYGDKPCTQLSQGDAVELLEKNPDYPLILKLRRPQPDKLIYDEHKNVIGKGVVDVVYGNAADLGTKMPE